MSAPAVQVTGLRELQAAFRQVDKELPKELRKAFKVIAAHVAGVAQQRTPFVEGTAARSIRPRATQKGAGIAFPGGGPESAGTKDGYFPWLDFGGATGRNKSIKRERIKGGRYVYPAIAESVEYIADEVYDAIGEAAQHARFETRGL